MKHNCLAPNHAVSHDPAQPAIASTPLSRRRFLSFFTAGATTLALQACGGGGAGAGGPVATPAAPTPTAPTMPTTTSPTLSWATVPTLTFVQGVPSSISVAQWISGVEPSAVSLKLNSIALPAGVTYNAATKSFDYDGVGAPSAVDGYVLTAVGG